MNVIPGRPDLNVERMRHWLAEARARQAEVVVFSEMCVPGYIVGDLWELDTLVLDFNFAYHASCVYSPRWSCPLAPPANHLEVPIRAGERLD